MALSLTGCGKYDRLEKRVSALESINEASETAADEQNSTIEEYKATAEEYKAAMEEQKKYNDKLEARMKALEAQNKKATTSASSNSSKDEQETSQQISAQKEEEASSIQIVAVYNGKELLLHPQSETDAINKPLAIYENVTCRDIDLTISGAKVKAIYVNQKEKLENINYNSELKSYCVYYYMPGEGQYTFMIETEADKYYVSVLY